VPKIVKINFLTSYGFEGYKELLLRMIDIYLFIYVCVYTHAHFQKSDHFSA